MIKRFFRRLLCPIFGHKFYRMRGTARTRLYFCDRCGEVDTRIKVSGIDKNQ